MADGCVFLMENINAKDMKKVTPDCFVNLGTGEDINLNDLVLIIKSIVGFEGNIKYDLVKPEGTPRKRLEVSKILELGWKPKYNLLDGLKITYKSYLSD